MRIVITDHAQERMNLLGIEKEQVIRCVQQGAKSRQTEGWLASFTYLKVAYKVQPDGVIKVKTVYIE